MANASMRASRPGANRQAAEGRHVGATGIPLLEPKFHAPRRRRGMVSRPRLARGLHVEGLPAVTLVSAPAGFGETTLVAEWLAEDLTAPPSTARPLPHPPGNRPAPD